MEGSESRTKKSTAQINRANFENARKILFGTERIPGTDRERWTTASAKPNMYDPARFTLGKYEFFIESGTFFLKNMHNEDTKLCSVESASVLKIILPKMQTNFRLGVGFRQRHLLLDTLMFIDRKSGGAYVNFTTVADNPFIDFEYFPTLRNIVPHDINMAQEYYQKTKKHGVERAVSNQPFSIGYSITSEYLEQGEEIFGELLELEQPLKEGVTIKSDNTLVVVSQGTPSLLLAVAAPFKSEYAKAIPKYFEDTTNDTSLTGFELPAEFWQKNKTESWQSIWHTSDLRYMTGAIDWLMHVLTGPDPRTYDSPIDPSLQDRKFRDQYKEASEPESYFSYDAYGSNFILRRKTKKQHVNELTFFIVQQETADAFAYVKNVLAFLNQYPYLHYGIGDINFAENLAKFASTSLDNELKREASKRGLTWELFKNAQLRLKQYEQHEFLGCNVCGAETKYRCSASKVPYCGIECQMVATKLK